MPTLTELIRSHRRRLTRRAYALARTGRYGNAEAVIQEIKGHKDFHPDSHDTATFRAALNSICYLAAQKLERQPAALFAEYT